MTKHTTVFHTLIVERSGRSGPENELRIAEFVKKLTEMTWQDEAMELSVEGHQYETTHETLD